MSALAAVSAAFAARFQAPPTLVVRAPGRVNLIGEHTDYNDGFVMPVAIDRWVWIALRPRDDARVSAFSVDLREAAELDLGALRRGGEGWAEYLKGTAWALQEAGHHLRGFEGVLTGDVPIGAGLSSSAALEMATARAFAAVSDLRWDAARMARIGQRAENEWVGVRCGIMDQMASAGGREGHALLIDCRTLAMTPVPLPPEVAVLVLDTSTRRGLVDSAYNERRAQCEQAARHLGVPALRDASTIDLQDVSAFQAGRPPLTGAVLRRARHVVTENDRALRAAEALREGDIQEVGRLLDESHRSLRDDFEVSSPALDAMVASARRAPGFLGARMTGAGFGGCVVALVRKVDRGAFVASVEASYARETGFTPRIHPCRASNGAEVVVEKQILA
jgi:galactokinase